MLLTQFLSIFFGSYRFVRVKSNVRCELGPRHSWCNRLETQLFYEESRNLSMRKKSIFEMHSIVRFQATVRCKTPW